MKARQERRRPTSTHAKRPLRPGAARHPVDGLDPRRHRRRPLAWLTYAPAGDHQVSVELAAAERARPSLDYNDQKIATAHDGHYRFGAARGSDSWKSGHWSRQDGRPDVSLGHHRR